MAPSPLSSAVNQARGLQPIGVPAAPSCSGVQPSPTPIDASALIANYGAVPVQDYPVVLKLSALSNLWQILQVAKTAWDAAPPEKREHLDQSVVGHVEQSAGLYLKALEPYRAASEMTQQQMLECDVAASGHDEISALIVPPEKLTTSILFDRLNDRISELQLQLGQNTSMSSIDWRGPGITGHLPVFHLEFGATCLELHYSVGG